MAPDIATVNKKTFNISQKNCTFKYGNINFHGKSAKFFIRELKKLATVR